MKFITSFVFSLTCLIVFSQSSENLIPKEAVSVFSVNNVSLLQKISLDDLVKYEFMEEVQQELFDGSTSGKTLKDSGFDFDKKVNVFFGKSHEFEISGLSFGVESRSNLFEVFDDFQATSSDYKGVDFYESYFNRLAIRGNEGVLFRITPNYDKVNTITDSIWYARGNDYPWYNEFDEESLKSLEEALEALEEIDTTQTNKEDPVDFFEEMEIEEHTANPTDNELLPVAGDDPTTKTYYELRDSVDLALQTEYIKRVCDELFIEGDNLISNAPQFVEQLTHESEGIFYLDNSRSLERDPGFWQIKALYPSFYKNLDDLYEGNILLGDLVINDHSIELKMDTQYGDKLGSIYEKMTDAKFDKNVLKYIHKDNNAYFTYRVNLREAYEQTYDVIVPMLEEETDVGFAAALLFLELWDEVLNKDVIFDTYKGSMFGSYNGIQKVKTKKFVFEYNEETFEYTEEEVEAEEDMPLFVLGFSTDRTDIPAKVLKYLSRIDKMCKPMEGYWEYENAILGSAPLYMILKNGLFIFTNDKNLAENHSDGYGAEALGKKEAKKARKSGFMYGYADLGKAIENIPRELFSDEENEMIDVIRGKSGTVEFVSSEVSSDKTSFNLRYNFEGEYDASGTYILDLINSFYVITK